MHTPFQISANGHRLGGPIPLACVPLVAPDVAALEEQVARICASRPAPDIVELRADHLRAITSTATPGLLAQLTTALGPTLPLLYTHRLPAEGGVSQMAEDERRACLYAAIQSGHIALIDIELAMPSDARQALITAAHQQGVPVIVSYHDFTGTPIDTMLAAHFHDLLQSGADAIKLAVMVQTTADSLRLLQATAHAAATANIPLISMAMGTAGMITRLVGFSFGSALSFATITASSAPGQLPLGLLRAYWDAAAIRLL